MLGPCPWREALGADMDGLKEVRLSRSVSTDHEGEARLEAQLERGVRAKAPKRDLRDDQPANLIGMIR
jgi:hypothetical protein